MNSVKTTSFLCLLITSQSALALRSCEDYISDQWPDSRYSINVQSATVIDKKTTLMWKRCSQGTSGASCQTGTAGAFTWQQALENVETLNNTTGFAGFNNWRLPNRKELRSLAAMNCIDPAINETAFPNTPLFWYWTSSPIIAEPNGFGFSWDIYFKNGNDSGFPRETELNVRLVRDTE